MNYAKMLKNPSVIVLVVLLILAAGYFLYKNVVKKPKITLPIFRPEQGTGKPTQLPSFDDVKDAVGEIMQPIFKPEGGAVQLPWVPEFPTTKPA